MNLNFLMQLGVYSLQKVCFEGEVISVNCRTAQGEITILDHHRPLVSILEKGIITIIDSMEKEHYIPVSSGFLEVTSENQTKMIVEEEV